MSFPRPTLAELVTAAEQDLSARVLDGEPLLQQSTLAALARVQAGGLHLLYGFLSWAARQVHVHNCEAEYLDALAATWGLARKAASYAAGTVTFTGADGAVVAAGAELKRADGALYTTTADATISGGAASAPVDAVEAGTGGNESAGVSLTLTSPVSGVQSTAAVAAGGITGGADQEADEALRARLITRIQQPPHGGAGYDYVAWALEVSGVTRAWCYPEHMGPGTVGLTFVCDDAEGGIIPDGETVAAVAAHIEAERPVTAEVFVFAPTAVALDLQITLTPDTEAVRAAVVLELADLLQREAEPGATILLSQINEAISIAAGETDHVLVNPTANVEHGTGEIPVLGAITWTGDE